MLAKTCVLSLLLLTVSYGICQSREAAQEAETKPDAPIPGLTDEQSRFFRYFDANQDGQISREEYRNVIVRFSSSKKFPTCRNHSQDQFLPLPTRMFRRRL